LFEDHCFPLSSVVDNPISLPPRSAHGRFGYLRERLDAPQLLECRSPSDKDLLGVVKSEADAVEKLGICDTILENLLDPTSE
jgi:hypothetical protein